MFKYLLDHMLRYIDLDEEEKAIVTNHFKYKKLSKKDYVLKSGDVCQGNYFILTGCLRLYVITNSGAEQILHFGISGWWMSDLDSFDKQLPSDYYIQAVECTEVAFISKANYEALMIKIPKLNKYFRIMMQIAYTAKLKKLELFLCHTAEERYHSFNKAFPDFVQRIPQYMLASFLGFTPGFLSLLRAKRSKVD
ncbi:MAG: Crp/Fnr family transcriptional regulator [Mucilaginibacter sp.]|uniref:Crp/Fnr family transcriptional regulator n=1 Tax=Mucilaginibacter sp. TaxID=1882438 RepID=UPI0031A91FF1